jgi:beta-N-acetylhexosaminidase/D-alanyl-D-alanine dipeptidase
VAPPIDAAPKRQPAALVDPTELEPSLVIEIRYATADNFVGEPVYPVGRCLLRRVVAERLVEVQRDLKKHGLGLKLWDCYRPFSVQEAFWKRVPDARYVARPVREDGVPVDGSKHNRGAAVDLTLVDADGRELAMPTDYDDFSERAHADFADLPAAEKANRARLAAAMERRGFAGIATEWWHFDGPDWQRYPLSDEPLR